MATDSAGAGSGPGDRDSDRGEELPDAVIEDLLASGRRRRLLAALRRRDGPVAVEDLAAALAADGDDHGSVGVDERREARLEIYQAHLPKLTATEVVRFDSMLGTIEYLGDPALETRLGDPEE